MNDSIAYRYSDKDNKLACAHDEVLIPIVINADKSAIKTYINEQVTDKAGLKNSMALVAYLYENEQIDKEIIVLLLDSGIDPNGSIFSRIPLHLIYDKIKVIDNDQPFELVNDEPYSDENIDAYNQYRNVRTLLPDYIDLFIQCGANLNIIDENGGTLMQTAAFRSDINVLRLLIGKGASVLIQDNYGETVLSYLLSKIADTNEDKDEYIVTETQQQMIELLDRSARKEMEVLGLLTQAQSAIQNWRCDYYKD